MTRQLKLGDWVFDPSVGTLTKAVETERLENRASRLLELLCQRNGELVTHAEIISSVWDGRVVSPNSIAVVIGNIRKALGDSAKQPQYIETVPKRGYRLLASCEPHDQISALGPMTHQSPDRSERRLISLVLGLSVIAILALSLFLLKETEQTPSEPLPVALIPVVNMTGDSSFAPLTAAYTDLILNDLVGSDSISVIDSSRSEWQVKAQIILWNDHPALSLVLTDKDDAVLWSGMAPGPEPKLVGQVQKQVQLLIKATKDLPNAAQTQG